MKTDHVVTGRVCCLRDRGLQLGRDEKKFGRGETSAYTHFTPDELIAYTERIRFTPTELGLNQQNYNHFIRVIAYTKHILSIHIQ